MQSYTEKRDAYFRDRFPGYEGIVDAVMVDTTPRSSSSIIVGHNDYLSQHEGGVMMSGIFQEGDKTTSYHKTRASLASWLRLPACHIAQSGMAANVNVVEALHRPGIPIYIDNKAHASFWKGIKCAMATRDTHRFRHNNMTQLRRLTALHGPGIILVESIYSTCGSFGPIRELCELRDKEGHVLVVDESHSLGLYGEEGSGYCSMLDVVPDFLTASLSKTVSVRAGIVASSHLNVKYVSEIGTAAIFSSVIEPHDVEAISLSVEKIKQKNEERAQIASISAYLREELVGLYGIEQTPHPSPIFGLTFPSETAMRDFQVYLHSEGIFGAVFCKPATPERASLVRLTINASVTMTQAERIVSVVKSYSGRAKL